MREKVKVKKTPERQVRIMRSWRSGAEETFSSEALTLEVVLGLFALIGVNTLYVTAL